MALQRLLNVPKDANEWNQFTWDHKDSHKRIIQAIQADSGISLTEYVIDPVGQNEVVFFLQNNQNFHNDMNGILGLQGSDLQSVDFKNENQFKAWIWNHWLEHQSAEQTLGIT